MVQTRDSHWSRAAVWLLALIFLRAFFLSQGGNIARLAVALCLLGLVALAVFLLRREGVAEQRLPLMVFLAALALLLRTLLMDYSTLDYQDFLSHWVDHFRQNGGFLALKDPVGNYNVPYLYLLSILSYLPIPDLYTIKLFSLLFDVLLAWGGFRLVRRLTQKETAPLWAFSLLLFLPTVVLNGACWAQCDSIWAALCLHALCCALDRKSAPSMALLALAFSFKLQAIFIIPLWAVFLLTGHIKPRHIPVFPGVFVLTMLPAILLGKPVGDILGVYLNQAGDSIAYETVNYNSPSVFSLLPYNYTPQAWMPKAGILLAFAFMLAVLAVLFLRRKTASDAALALAGAALSLGIPFFLPYMHERYFYLGGVLLAALACALPELMGPAIGAELASLGGYHAYLFTRYAMLVTLAGVTWGQLGEGVLMLLALALTLLHLWKSLFQKPIQSPPARSKR